MDGRGWFVTDGGQEVEEVVRLEDEGGCVEGGGRGQAASGRFQTRKRKRSRVSVVPELARASQKERVQRRTMKRERKREAAIVGQRDEGTEKE